VGTFISGRRMVTSEQLLARACRAATGFSSLGIGPGMTVALFLRNDFVFYEVMFACNLIGAYPVAVNWHSSANEAAYVVRDCGAQAIVVHADLLSSIRDALPRDVPVIVAVTPEEIRDAYGIDPRRCEVPADRTNWDAWRDAQAPIDPGPLGPPTTIIYTSGTTGNPKGVRRMPATPEQAKNFVDMANDVLGFKDWLKRPDQLVTVMVGPMYHAAPNSYGIMAARIGGTVILQPRFDAAELLKIIEKYRVTHIHMVPIMFHRLLKLPREIRDRYDVSSLRFVVHGAAPCPPAVKRAMIDWWGPIIYEYYGSTETGGPVAYCNSQEWLEHEGTVGHALGISTLKILDENGGEAPAGTVGEIACLLHGIADFTYQGDDAKRRALDRDGLIALGDVGYLDEDGYLYICDRSIDMINSGGVNIYPAEIEAALLSMPGVLDCAVFGVADDEYGESVCAVVQTPPGSGMSEAKVRAYLGGRIAKFKVPRRIHFTDGLPREDSGKIFKRKLRDEFGRDREERI
jgi:long-chain acyl-CoA synthetase